MSKHTPGPWAISPTSRPETEFSVADTSGMIICRFDRWICDAEPEQDANARLIAAAPELLAALQALTEWGCTYTSPLKPNSPHDLLIAARDAISKATTPE
mgnify:CR=1 FL=1